MRIQVVGNVRVDACPCSESLELALGLGHVRVEERKVANVGRSHLGVRVGRVVSLVAAGAGRSEAIRARYIEHWNVLFNPANKVLFGRKLAQFLVMLEQLRGGLGDHDMVA